MITDEILQAIEGCEDDELANLLVRVARVYAERNREEMAKYGAESQTLSLDINGVTVIDVEITYHYEWQEEVKKALKAHNQGKP